MITANTTPNPVLERLEVYLALLAKTLGHKDRIGPFQGYCAGLLLSTERKTVEPMAALVDPAHAAQKHQSMHHFVADSPWRDEALLAAAYNFSIIPMTSHGPIEHWIIDDSGMPKSGDHSVGVARQYCGATGKTDNCQVAVSLSVSNGFVSLPVGYRLYLPKDWANDGERRRKAGVPPAIRFQKKWEIALDLIDHALASGKPRAPVAADAGYGDVTEFREGLTARQLPYIVGVKSTVSVWPPGHQPLPPKPHRGPGRPSTSLRRDADHQPLTTLDLAKSLPPEAFQQVAWREGTRGTMRSRFAAVQVRPAHRDYYRQEPRPEEWLLIEWPAKEKEPTKYWLSTLDPAMPIRDLVRQAKERWHIERDYQELKDELGLDHYEGRNWRGFHHHASLCIAAYAFLVAERSRFSPLSLCRGAISLQGPPIPPGCRRRGAPATRTAPAHVDHHAPEDHHHLSQPALAPLSDVSSPDPWAV